MMSPRPAWSFISNHGAVLALAATCGRITACEMADRLGITERAVRRIVRDLEDGGYLTRERSGRVNHYTVAHDRPLRRQGTDGLCVGDLITLLCGDTDDQ